MRLFGDLSFDKDNGSFPENPATNQISLVDGILYIYSSINGVRTWYPLTHKKASYIHTQAIPAIEWTLTHNQDTEDFGYFAYDAANNIMFTSVEIIDRNTIKIILSEPSAGKAIMFFDYEITAKNITGDNLNITNIEGMFSKVGNDIIFSGNLIPDTADTWSIGNPSTPVKDMYISANTLHIGDLQISASGVTMPPPVSPTTVDDAPSISTSNFTVETFTYNPGTGNVIVDPSLNFKDSGGTVQSISYNNDSSKFSLNTNLGEGLGSLEGKSVTLSNSGSTALDITGDTVQLGNQTISGNLSVTGNATLGDTLGDTITVNGVLDVKTPIVFSEDASLGDGNDNVLINCGTLNTFEVISQYFSLDGSGNLTVTGDVTVQGTLTTAVQDVATTTNSTITDQFFVANGGGTLDAGLQVDRGASTTAVLQFNETNDKWEAGLSGTTKSIVLDDDPRLVSDAGFITDLTDSGDTALHYHATDRDRANHTGTQLASTISNFTSTVNSIISSPLSSKVDKVAGKVLSSNDFTDALLTKLNALDPTALDNLSWADINNKPTVYYQSAIPADRLTTSHVDNIILGKLANGDAPVPVLEYKDLITVTDETVVTYNVNYEPSFVMVYIGRQLLRPSEYTATNGTSITFNIPLAVDDEIDVVTSTR